MARTVRANSTYTNRIQKSTGRRTNGHVYMYDNTARKLDIQRQLEEQPARQLSHEVRKTGIKPAI